MEPKEKDILVVISAKISKETRRLIKNLAAAEDRTESQIVRRLLDSHPALNSEEAKNNSVLVAI